MKLSCVPPSADFWRFGARAKSSRNTCDSQLFYGVLNTTLLSLNNSCRYSLGAAYRHMMWWPLSLPTPYDAQVRSAAPGGQLSTQSGPRSTSTRPQSYSNTFTRPEPEGESRWQTLWTSRRSRQQFSVFAAGAGLVLLSSLVTRRALARKYLSLKPKGLFSPSNDVKPAPGGLDAAEALGLATLNVTSFAAMMVGGGLWAFDISNMEELRAKVRKGMDIDGKDKSEAEVEEDIEEWMAVMLARLQGKNDKDIGEMIKQAALIGQNKKS